MHLRRLLPISLSRVRVAKALVEIRNTLPLVHPLPSPTPPSAAACTGHHNVWLTSHFTDLLLFNCVLCLVWPFNSPPRLWASTPRWVASPLSSAIALFAPDVFSQYVFDTTKSRRCHETWLTVPHLQIYLVHVIAQPGKDSFRGANRGKLDGDAWYPTFCFQHFFSAQLIPANLHRHALRPQLPQRAISSCLPHVFPPLPPRFGTATTTPSIRVPALFRQSGFVCV